MHLGVLGPLTAHDGRGPVGLRGPRHRAVLARLLVARGRVVPTDVLVEDVWDGTPPDAAVGTLQTFVAALRRSLEPDRPPRAPATLLVTAAPGYALRVRGAATGSERLADVDADLFEAAVTAPGTDLAGVEEALARWRGPAYAEFTERPWARAEIARLDELRLLAVERRARLLLDLDRVAEAAGDLTGLVAEHPWREDAWRLLALAHYRAGRQGDALAALRRARTVLADDLGVDPGPALRQLEADVLAHAPHLLPAPTGTTGSRPGTAPPGTVRRPGDPAPSGTDHGGTAAGGAVAGGGERAPARTGAGPLVGRDAERAQLDRAAVDVVAAGGVRLALVSGEAGAGKSALVADLADRLGGAGWTTAWGAVPDHPGAPADWPWTQVLTALTADHGPAPAPDPGSRFHWHRAVGAYLDDVAQSAPLLVVLDDLHRAGEDALALLAAVVTEPAGAGPVLVVGTHRSTEVSAALGAFLARVARAEPVRVYPGGLDRAAVAALLAGSTGGHRRGDDGVTAVPRSSDEVVAAVHRRSGGNAFFVRELARLLATDGPAALDAVPAGVRDVVRHRVAALPAVVRDVLGGAAVVGGDVDLDLLPGELDAEALLAAVEEAVAAGLLVEVAPGRVRFAHDLVRETLYADQSRSRLALRHARVARRLEAARPGAAAALAHHFHRAGDLPAAGRHARTAARTAEAAHAAHEAARWWELALDAHDATAGGAGAGDRDRLEFLTGLARTLAVSGQLGRARRLRAEAVELAERLDEDRITAQVLTAFDVPALWSEPDDPRLAARIAAATEHALAALPDLPAGPRSRLLAGLAVELRRDGGDRARAAAGEAERLARTTGDPAVLAYALNARFLQSFHRAGLAPERAALGAELVELAERHDLADAGVLGHLVLAQARSALADLDAATAHVTAAQALGERHDVPLVAVFARFHEALRTSLTGGVADAEAAYRRAAAALEGSGMTGLENGTVAFAVFCLRLRRGGGLQQGLGSFTPWCRPLLDPACPDPVPDSPRDHLYEARTCLQARIALARGDRETIDRLYDALLPAADELAGAGSGLLTLGPVAEHLADLADALGRPAVAADHRERAAHLL